jgi:hypothetical protein
MTGTCYACCEHCEHEDSYIHEHPCIHGCNDDEEAAYQEGVR